MTMWNIKYQALTRCWLFSIFFLLAHGVFAQDSGQSSADSGVLVSSPTHTPISDQNNAGNNESNDASSPSTPEKNSDSRDTSNSSTDEIVVKATDAAMFQITANLKLPQDQINAIRPIITDNIIKVRKLQQSVEDGTIDSKAMYDQRQQLMREEYQELSHIISSDQLKVWINMQNG